MAKTYLVTGAAGFIGSAVANHYIKQGHTVYTIDNLSTGFESNIPKGVHFLQGNCYDPNIIKQLEGKGIKAILHIAGQSSGEISFENPSYDLNTNTLSTLLLLDFARNQGIKTFVYASTMSVYGDQEIQPVVEKAISSPKSFYAVGKVASEHYLKIYHSLGVRSTILRLFNVYGPGQNLENMKQGMVSIFMAQALSKEEIEVRGSLERYRDFVYIDDVVTAFSLAEQYTTNFFEIFNICSGVKTTVGKLVGLINDQLPKQVPLKVKEGTPGDQFGVIGSHDKARAKLGWKPTVEITEGIKRMYRWAKS